MTTEERLETLEKELARLRGQPWLTRAKRRNRRLLAAVGLAAGVVALVWIVAGAGCNAHSVIRAREITLEDENGKTRVGLAVTKDGPALTLIDETGKGRAVLAVTKDGPTLGLFDANGVVRAMLDVTKDGPTLGLTDENGKTRAGLAVTKDGPAMVLADENGKVTWRAP